MSDKSVKSIYKIAVPETKIDANYWNEIVRAIFFPFYITQILLTLIHCRCF